MKGKLFVVVVFLTLLLAWFGCKKPVTTPTDFSTPTVSGTNTVSPTISPTFTVSQTHTITPTFTPFVYQPHPSGWIDDCEDTFAPNANDYNGANPALNVGGYWITYDDRANTGTSYVWPMSADWAVEHGIVADKAAFNADPQYRFTMSAPGYDGSTYGQAYAARMTGYVTTSVAGSTPPWETVAGYQYGFIGMGTQLTVTAGEPDCIKVDISAYTGIKCWVKGDGEMYHIKLPYTKTTLCDTKDIGSFTAHDDYKFSFIAPTVWSELVVPFTNMTQAGWGTPATRAAVLGAASQIQFQTDQSPAGADYWYNADDNGVELWVDDIQLY